MKIFGVNIVYDEAETREICEEYKDRYTAEELLKMRVYEITDEYDQFRKYQITFCRRQVVRACAKKIFGYRLRRLRYFFSRNNPIRRETSRPLPHRE